MDFDFLFRPVEEVDAFLTGLFDGAPLAVALLIAFVLGLRHASDPDHLVAVTSLVTADGGDSRRAARLGAYWGLGHASALIVIGLPLIVFKEELPIWLEAASEKAVGIVILVLAARILFKWVRGDYRAGRHEHRAEAATDVSAGTRHRHLREGVELTHSHRPVRTPQQSFAIGLLHGLAGTGAVVLLLIAALPSQLEAALALAIFAPMSVLSMAVCTGAFAWVITRRRLAPAVRSTLIPALGVFGLMFGSWYVGIT